ncbi:MAG TPA: hypothetical protein VHR39_05395 [Propionibacteriaceae bacterium]|nr:hypothetical protein [Propionibacteriaceae bacterium]
MSCSRLWECGVVLAGVKAKPWRVAYGQPGPQLRATPEKAAAGSRPGMQDQSGGMVEGCVGVGVGRLSAGFE